jgi:hypothetical protein
MAASVDYFRMDMKSTDYARHVRLVTAAVAITLLAAPTVLAQTAPTLGAAQSFAVLGGTSVSNTGPSVINGDLGISPGLAGSITGMNTATVNGSTYAGPLTLAGQAQSSRSAALINLQGQACNDSAGAGIYGTVSIGPGVHCFASTLLINGPVTLNAGGNPNAVFIFKVGSSLTTAVGSLITLTGGAQACNVFWAVTQDTTIEVGSAFVGNIIGGRDLVAKTNAHMYGRALTAGDLTLDSNTVDATVCSGVGGVCASGGSPTITAIPNQVIPVVPVGGSVAVGFTISGAVIPDALNVVATTSDTTLIPQNAMTITKGVGGARVLTIFGADGRSGVATITVTVTDPSNPLCATSVSFRLTVGAVPVPTMSQWAMGLLMLLLTGGGVVALRRRARDRREGLPGA